MTTSVTDDQVRDACAAYWHERTVATSNTATDFAAMRAAIEAALSIQTKAVSVYALRALPRCDMFSEGFHNGSSRIEYDWNPSGEWIKYADLTAIIGEGD